MRSPNKASSAQIRTRGRTHCTGGTASSQCELLAGSRDAGWACGHGRAVGAAAGGRVPAPAGGGETARTARGRQAKRESCRQPLKQTCKVGYLIQSVL